MSFLSSLLFSFVFFTIPPLFFFTLAISFIVFRPLSSYLAINFVFIIIHHLNCVFSLCSFEENLHTYLTTWLSSCPVTIFTKSHHILLIKIIIQSENPKNMCHSKINSHQFVKEREAWRGGRQRVHRQKATLGANLRVAREMNTLKIGSTCNRVRQQLLHNSGRWEMPTPMFSAHRKKEGQLQCFQANLHV